MLERLCRRESLRRVKLEQLAEQIQCVFRRSREDGRERRRLVWREFDVVGQRAHARPQVVRGRAERVEDLAELIELVHARQVGRAQHELCQDAAGAPHVDGAAVLPGAKEQLRRPVPYSADHGGHVPVGAPVDAREAKVTNLNLSVGPDEQILGLEVSVQHEVRVAVLEPSQQHEHVALDVGLREHDGLVLDDVVQVVGQDLEHDVHRVVGHKHVEQLDDVRVFELGLQLDLAQRREVHPVLKLPALELLDGHAPPRGLLHRRVHDAEGALTQHRPALVPLHFACKVADLVLLGDSYMSPTSVVCVPHR